MKRFITLLCLLAISTAAHAINGRVIGVIDGDTLDILDSGNRTHRVRLHGIDAPEKGQAFASLAKQKLSMLCFGKNATVEGTQKNLSYDRVVGIVTCQGENANLEMVRSGFAWVYRQYTKDPEYYQAETSAKAARKGLWEADSPTPPWAWRHAK